MTTVNEDTGRILWSQESKYYLVRLIKENIVIVSPDVSAETMAKKEEAWKNIEENFAADGMHCQLSKIKRLWKRMKDTARQNIAKFNEQKRRGVKGPKSLKPPTELDYKVAQIISHRNMSKIKPKLRTQLTPIFSTNNYLLNGTSDEDNCIELDQRETDVLEPMTILEEGDRADSSLKTDSVIDISNDNDESNDLIEPNQAGMQSPNDDDLDSELLPHEIRLRIIQRQNEKERISMERELFRKKSILLDLQIKKINLELDYLMRSN